MGGRKEHREEDYFFMHIGIKNEDSSNGLTASQSLAIKIMVTKLKSKSTNSIKTSGYSKCSLNVEALSEESLKNELTHEDQQTPAFEVDENVFINQFLRDQLKIE